MTLYRHSSLSTDDSFLLLDLGLSETVPTKTKTVPSKTSPSEATLASSKAAPVRAAMKRKHSKEDDDPKAEFETTGAESRVG